LTDLEQLIRRGHELRDALDVEGRQGPALAATRIWQQDCAALVSHLSGGSKAHWLAREFSQAFLVRSPSGGVVEETTLTLIVERILRVLDRASVAVSGQQSAVGSQPSAGPQVRRFEFVHDTELRPILEQAYMDSRSALENGQFGLAFVTSCSVLEAILTDALEHADDAGKVRDWSFDTRIVAAERRGLIRGACARLPPSARTYRELTTAEGDLRPDIVISQREARLAGQVLQVVMRDLDPGR
jgi:hypothetical protein